MHKFWRTLRTVLGLYRCFACRRWLVIHDMRELARCENAPLAITITTVSPFELEGQGEDLEKVATG